MTEWRVCPGHPEYEISEVGNVRRLLPDALGRLNTHIFKPKTGNSGYLEIGLGPMGARRWHLLHRLVARAFLGEPPTDKHEVAHKDGVKANIHFRNLRWATHSENEADKKAHGTFRHASYKGEAHPGAKLTDVDVLSIRQDLASGVSRKVLALRHGVTGAHIYRVATGRARMAASGAG